jgi:chemotaxis protein CheX
MELGETELKVFVDTVTHYFLQTTKEPAVVRAAYLADGVIPRFEYTGLITVSGSFRGCVHFSAPAGLVKSLLIELGERDQSDENLLDAVGEIANTIAGNAQRHFGKALEISVPVKLQGGSEQIKAAVRARPFVIALQWRRHSAVVVVDMESTNQ